MSNGVNFYMQKYPQGTTTFPVQDIEAVYKCKYRQFKDLVFDGDVSNIYTESFTEHSGVRTYIPNPEDLAFKEYECKLQLLFNRKTCQADSETFYKTFRGQLVEYHDTFRNKYATLLMIKRPVIQQEKLYSGTPYQLVEFTFTNFKGTTFTTSQI